MSQAVLGPHVGIAQAAYRTTDGKGMHADVRFPADMLGQRHQCPAVEAIPQVAWILRQRLLQASIRIGVYQWSSPSGKAIGEHCCLPAGGQSTPWTTTVTYSGAVDPVLVITASTGGHLRGVEQMAFTAVRRNS